MDGFFPRNQKSYIIFSEWGPSSFYARRGTASSVPLGIVGIVGFSYIPKLWQRKCRFKSYISPGLTYMIIPCMFPISISSPSCAWLEKLSDNESQDRRSLEAWATPEGESFRKKNIYICTDTSPIQVPVKLWSGCRIWNQCSFYFIFLHLFILEREFAARGGDGGLKERES